MAFEKGDSVVLRDQHSEFDGEVGEITRVSETMFGDENYTIRFEDGQEAGIPADALEAADEPDQDTNGEGPDGDEPDEE